MHTERPELKAIILDFASVNNVDITSVQHLIDVRNQLDMYASPASVDWHFAHINNRWTKRALASAGFGFPSPANADGAFRRWKPVFSVAEIGGSSSAAAEAEDRLRRRHGSGAKDVEALDAERTNSSSNGDAEHADTIGAGDFDKSLAQSKAYGRRAPRRRRAGPEPPAVPRRPDKRAAERHRQRGEARGRGAEDVGVGRYGIGLTTGGGSASRGIG